jgi:hypothetical protein
MTLEIDLSPTLQEKLEAIAAQRGLDVPHLVVETLEKLDPPTSSHRRAGESSGEFILRLAEEMRASMPEADWMGMPSDHARNYKHYLYGAPKEE